MLSRGRYSRRTAWRVREKAPAMIAWEAITVATQASATVG
jgi:hypothetical protein